MNDPIVWYSPCGYERPGLFSSAQPIPTCPNCHLMAWSTIKPAPEAESGSVGLDAALLAEALHTQRINSYGSWCGDRPEDESSVHDEDAADIVAEYARLSSATPKDET